MFNVFGGGDSTNITHIKDYANSGKAEKQKAARAALRQWWMELQHNLEVQLKKDATEEKAKGKPFLLQTTDALQPLVDIAFYRYWDLDQAREEGERYIAEEQTYRFLDDLVRDNEDAAVATLKDYVKYKLIFGSHPELTTKKEDLTKDAKEVAEVKHDLGTALQTAEKDVDTVDKLEEAITKAKEKTVDTKDAEEKLGKLKEQKKEKDAAKVALDEALGSASVETIPAFEKAINTAKRLGHHDVAEANNKLEELKEQKKLKGAEESEAQKKNREKKAAHEVEHAKKEGERKATELENLAKERADDKTAVVEAAGKEADADFSGKFNKAVEAVVADLVDEYKKSPFMKRQSAGAKFREQLGAKDKITQNEMNQIFNLYPDPEKREEAEKKKEEVDSTPFDDFCKELGFNPASFEAVMNKLSEKPEAAEEKEEKKEEKKEEEKEAA